MSARIDTIDVMESRLSEGGCDRALTLVTLRLMVEKVGGERVNRGSRL